MFERYAGRAAVMAASLTKTTSPLSTGNSARREAAVMHCKFSFPLSFRPPPHPARSLRPTARSVDVPDGDCRQREHDCNRI